MRKLVSVFVFSVALFIGLFAAPVENPTIYEKVYPLFSRSEADNLLGRRVITKYSSSQKALVGMKYSLNAEENFIMEKIQSGETGQVVAVEELENGFYLEIKWDKKDKYGRDMFSYGNRFSSRVFWEFE